jgi:hypothetical protein
MVREEMKEEARTPMADVVVLDAVRDPEVRQGKANDRACFRDEAYSGTIGENG